MFLFLSCSPDWDANPRLIWQQTKPPWRRQGTVWSRRQLTSKCRMIMLLLLRVLVDITATLIEIRWSWWRSWRPLWPPWWRDLLSITPREEQSWLVLAGMSSLAMLTQGWATLWKWRRRKRYEVEEGKFIQKTKSSTSNIKRHDQNPELSNFRTRHILVIWHQTSRDMIEFFQGDLDSLVTSFHSSRIQYGLVGVETPKGRKVGVSWDASKNEIILLSITKSES